MGIREAWYRKSRGGAVIPLHWLPVHQRMKFKMAVLVYKSIHGLAPQYLVQDCELVAAADRRQLRSSDIATFHVPTLASAIGHFQLLDHDCGTTCRPTHDSLTLPFHSSARR